MGHRADRSTTVRREQRYYFCLKIFVDQVT